MTRPLVQIVRLRPLTTQIRRLAAAQERTAHALELLLLHITGIDVNAKAAAKSSDPHSDAEVTYSTDQATAEREAEEELEKLGYRPPTFEEE